VLLKQVQLIVGPAAFGSDERDDRTRHRYFIERFFQPRAVSLAEKQECLLLRVRFIAQELGDFSRRRDLNKLSAATLFQCFE
jgi:hypothetical protein